MNWIKHEAEPWQSHFLVQAMQVQANNKEQLHSMEGTVQVLCNLHGGNVPILCHADYTDFCLFGGIALVSDTRARLHQE